MPRYVDRAIAAIDRLLVFPWYKGYLEWITDAGLRKVRSLLLERLVRTPPRFDGGFAARPEVSARIDAYLGAVALELQKLNGEPYRCGLPSVDRLIFGHTPEPVVPAATLPPAVSLPSGRALPAWNTGGWLTRPGVEAGAAPVGAAVFRYETGAGFSSVVV